MSKEPIYDYDVFIFYADADENWVESTLIRQLGVPKKRIITRKKINPGAFTGKEFDHAISNSRYIILVLSPSYFADKWSSYSERVASYISDVEQREHLIYLLLQPCNLPYSIEAHGYQDWTKQEDWQERITSLRKQLKRKKPKQRLIPCPYPGLPAFSEENSEYFFGRELQIEEFILKLSYQNYFFIIGPSGSGKSSFVSAGVIPELHKQMPHQWLVESMRPGSNPMDTLMSILGLSSINVPGSVREYTELIQSFIISHPPSKNFLLFIDQFEELFVQIEKKTDQLAFIAALKNLSQVKTCALVLAMRADFYGDLMDSALWPISERLDIAPLRGTELRDAIVNPAQSLEVVLERDLIERLISDAAEEPGVLPLFQATMRSLWGKREGFLLTLHSYKELGKNYKNQENSSLSGLAVALIAMADGAYNELTNDERKKIARRIFLRLIQFGEGRADVRRDIRRQQFVEDLKSEDDDPVLFEETLKHLTDKRLLTLSGEEKHGSKKVDIAHEALIMGWPKLKSWIDERQEAEQTRRRLEANATEWLRLSRRGGLLDSVELLEAERWLASPYASDLGGFSDNLQKLVEESRKQNLRLEEMYRNSERDRMEAERQRVIALARQLGAQAELLRNQQSNLLERSVLLAIESMKRYPTLETAHTLRQGLGLIRQCITTLTHGDSVKMAVFSPRGDYIATASDDHTVIVWEVASGQQQVFTLEDCAKDVTFSPDGQYVATACDDGSVGIWKTTNNQTLALIKHEEPVNALAFSRDGKYLASASWDTTVKITEVDNQRHFATLAHESGVLTVAFSSDGQHLVTSGVDKFAYLWNLKEANLDNQLPVKLPHEDIVNAVVFSKDDLQVATGSWDHTACVWETASGRLIARMNHAGSVNAVTFSFDGKYLATASDDRTAAVWETTSGKQVASLIHEKAVKTVVFSPNNAHIVSASEDCTARVWEMAGNHLFIPLLHEGFVHSAAFSPHGDYVVTSSEDNTARVWTTSNGRELQRLRHNDVVNVAVISPDGEYVITASHDKSAIIWDIYTGQPITPLPHKDKVYDIAVSPNNKYFVTASWDGTAQVWELPNGQPIATLHHNNLVYAVAFSPNSKFVATASWDKTARVWEFLTRSKEPSFTLNHKEKVKHVTFSSDGKYIATASDDHTAKIWRVVYSGPLCQDTKLAEIRATILLFVSLCSQGTCVHPL